MAYEMVMPYHLHMPSYFLETFTEYPYVDGPDYGGVFQMNPGKVYLTDAEYQEMIEAIKKNL